MENKYLFILVYVSVMLLLCQGCTERYPVDQLSTNDVTTTSDTTYLEIYPPFQHGFSNPTAVLFGKDQFLYVADTKNNRVVVMDAAGGYLGEFSVHSPISLGQDYRLDLFVGGTIKDSVGAIFRIHLQKFQQMTGPATIDTIYVEDGEPQRRFVGFAMLPDNKFLTARTGTDNSSIYDPDTRVMYFSNQGNYVTPISDLVTVAGTGIIDINKPTGLLSFPNSYDFILLQKNEGVAYGAIWMTYSADLESWSPKFNPSNAAQVNVDFIKRNRFVYPTGVAIDNKRNDVFIADVAQDSIFKFNKYGSLRKESFGLYGTGGRLVSPSGITFFDKTLYIADSTKNCIYRYKLSIDF
jgi:DNA-binding beta-propeller fold protein YncE